MSDLILFGTLFIAFAVLSSHVPMGTPSAKELFGESLGFVLTETFALLISSVTFGFAVLAAYKERQPSFNLVSDHLVIRCFIHRHGTI